MPLLIGLFNLVQLFQPVQPRELVSFPVKGPPEDGYASKRLKLRTVLRQHHTYKVSAVTISNGGNNLSIYIPMLATSTLSAALVTVAVCYLAVITWLTLSFRLTRLPLIAIHLSRHARRLFPFVLMWLGVRILHDSGAWTGLRIGI
jgi:cadmium resistance protein CadD (predicted permease)